MNQTWWFNAFIFQKTDQNQPGWWGQEMSSRTVLSLTTANQHLSFSAAFIISPAVMKQSKQTLERLQSSKVKDSSLDWTLWSEGGGTVHDRKCLRLSSHIEMKMNCFLTAPSDSVRRAVMQISSPKFQRRHSKISQCLYWENTRLFSVY